MRTLKTLYIFVVFVFFSMPLSANPVPGKPAPKFTSITTSGETISLAALKGETIVLEWTNHECPYVRKHYSSGNMQRTQRTLTEEGVIWVSIISSAPELQGYVSAEEANTLSASRGSYTTYTILDSDGSIGRLYGAKTTPQMFLINKSGNIDYMGAIDDRPSSRAESLVGATNYLLKAWEELRLGQGVTLKSTKPYGCSVKYAE